MHQESVPCTEPSVDQESMAGTDTLTTASNIDELEMSEEDIKSLVENTTLNILRTFQVSHYLLIVPLVILIIMVHRLEF